MYELDRDKPSLDDAIAHFGVRGMKWGQRKSKLAVHPRYRESSRANDREALGKRGVMRVNADMHKGYGHAKAVDREINRSAAKSAAVVVGGLVLISLLSSHGGTSLGSAANSSRRVRGGVAAAKVVNAKHGVYKITTMK